MLKQPTLIFAFLLIQLGQVCLGQTDSLSSKIKFGAYIETYYSYDFGNPKNNERPGFMYSFDRHDEVSLNLGFLKAGYDNSKIRANLAFMAGSYTNANLASESGTFKNIFEANAGIKISKKKNLWIDAGIFPSHIGFESAIGIDCWNVTRSMMAENSPYYESGVKISYDSDNKKWFMSGLIINGWQRITIPTGNTTPGIGHQITFKPNGSISLNSSSFVGNIQTDSNIRMRYFHNFYCIAQLNKKFAITLGFDNGMQEKSEVNSKLSHWFSPVFMVRFSPTDKFNISSRFEYYSDKEEVIIKTGTKNGFQTLGSSLNLDYKIQENMLCRIEGRILNSKDKIFLMGQRQTSHNIFVTGSLAFRL